jgi:hypothetical protein
MGEPELSHSPAWLAERFTEARQVITTSRQNLSRLHREREKKLNRIERSRTPESPLSDEDLATVLNPLRGIIAQ